MRRYSAISIFAWAISGFESIGINLSTSSMGRFHHCRRSSKLIISSSNLRRMTFAGLPTAIENGGMSEATVAFAPIMAPSPICTPGMIVTFCPIHTSLPMQCVEHLAAQRIANLRVQKSENVPFLPLKIVFHDPPGPVFLYPQR